eukprot:31483-Pelagococcus_subviridis.AAC.26
MLVPQRRPARDRVRAVHHRRREDRDGVAAGTDPSAAAAEAGGVVVEKIIVERSPRRASASLLLEHPSLRAPRASAHRVAAQRGLARPRAHPAAARARARLDAALFEARSRALARRRWREFGELARLADASNEDVRERRGEVAIVDADAAVAAADAAADVRLRVRHPEDLVRGEARERVVEVRGGDDRALRLGELERAERGGVLRSRGDRGG